MSNPEGLPLLICPFQRAVSRAIDVKTERDWKRMPVCWGLVRERAPEQNGILLWLLPEATRPAHPARPLRGDEGAPGPAPRSGATSGGGHAVAIMATGSCVERSCQQR